MILSIIAGVYIYIYCIYIYTPSGKLTLLWKKHNLDPFGIGKWLMSHGFNSYVKLPEVIYVYMYIYILIYIYTERGDLERGDLHIV
jgi:hypothetical protein